MNENFKNKFLMKPSKKVIRLIIFFWFIGNGLLVLSATDLFTDSFFQKKYVMIYFLMFFSTCTVGKLYINFFKINNLE